MRQSSNEDRGHSGMTLMTDHDALKMQSVMAESACEAGIRGPEGNHDANDAYDAFSLFLSRAGIEYFRGGGKVRVCGRGLNSNKRHKRHRRHGSALFGSSECPGALDGAQNRCKRP